MKHKIKHIKGTLTPTNTHVVSKNTSSRINKAATASGLNQLVKNCKREVGIIEINSVQVASRFPANDILTLVSSLHDFLKEGGIMELGLQGSLMMTIELDDIQPLMIRVMIEDEQITYQEAILDWAQKKSYP